jgi:hypothetical protein
VVLVSSKSRQQVVVEAIRQWQTRLLQLDRRNALLYFSVGKRGVMLRDRDPDALLERLATSRAGLAFAYAERVRVSRDGLFDVPAVSGEHEREVRVRPGDLETDLEPLELQKIGTDTIIVTIHGVYGHDRAYHGLPESLHPATRIM